MRAVQNLTALALATGLAVSLGLAGSATAAPTTPNAASSVTADGIYISPWGSADVAFSPAAKAYFAERHVTLGAIAPFTKTPDGFHMPIGSTEGDHVDSKGRIFYPGGMSFTYPNGTVVELRPTYIRVMPTPGYSAGVVVNGKQVSPEILAATTTPAEVLANGRPTFTGFKLDRVPFHITQELTDTLAQASGEPGPKAGDLFATLTPYFDYVPTRATN
ncbi:hypothetical protein ACFZAM_05260 [Streptomyces sp. NPDC008079]|uniref:hypothetical protein n=1 Tax=Streptomyces sp. NPDC008079 TaxID=3364806 RepID=UPI0036EE8930